MNYYFWLGAEGGYCCSHCQTVDMNSHRSWCNMAYAPSVPAAKHDPELQQIADRNWEQECQLQEDLDQWWSAQDADEDYIAEQSSDR